MDIIKNCTAASVIKTDVYVMGTDYDGLNFSMCVMQKGTGGKIISMYNGRTKKQAEYEREIEKVANLYQIPEKNIYKS